MCLLINTSMYTSICCSITTNLKNLAILKEDKKKLHKMKKKCFYTFGNVISHRLGLKFHKP